MAQAPDTLAIVIRRVEDSAGGYYQVALRRHARAYRGGPFRQREALRPAAVFELQREYVGLLERMLVLAEVGAPVPELDLSALDSLGREIAAILPESVRESLVLALMNAQDRRRGLQITLQVDERSRELLGVPWELMVLPFTRGSWATTSDAGFLLLNADVSLVRQVRGIGHNTRPALTRPLKLLTIAAKPCDVRDFNVEPTRLAIAALLSEAVAARSWYDGPDTLNALQARLRALNPQVLHLLCHGEQHDTGRGVRSDLLLTHRDGYTQRAGAADLVPILTLASDLQLVVLEACHLGLTPVVQGVDQAQIERARRASESIALALVRAGVRMVIAMQGEVRRDAAGAFVRACYSALADGTSVEQAVAAGRIAVWTAGGVVDWSQLVIFQGSGWPEQPAWHTQLADRFMQALSEPGSRRALRAVVVALALALLAASTLRWILPASPAAELGSLILPLASWAALGIVGPAAIAATAQSVRDRDDLPATVRSAARIAQFVGAYLGYAVGGITCFGLLVALWVIGPLVFVPVALVPTLVYLAILGSLFVSYAAARSQALAAVAGATVAPHLYGRSMLLLSLVATLAMFAGPALLLLAPPVLLQPAAVGAVMAVVLLTFVLRS